MDPMTAATAAVTLLAPYARKAAEEFAGEIGKSVFEKTKQLWSNVVGALKSDPVASDLASRFEVKPETYGGAFTDILAEKMADQPELLNAIVAEIESIKKQAPELSIVQKIKRAEGVVGLEAEELVRGSVEIEQEIEDAKGGTAAKIRKIGGS